MDRLRRPGWPRWYPLLLGAAVALVALVAFDIVARRERASIQPPTSSSASATSTTTEAPTPPALKGVPAFTWRQLDLPPTHAFDTVIVVDGRFYDIGTETRGGVDARVILSSEDGVGWSVLSRPAAPEDVLGDLTWVDGRFIAIVFRWDDPESPISRAWTSADAIEWRPWFDLGKHGPVPRSFAKVDGRWVATTMGTQIMTSDDGERWVPGLDNRFEISRPIVGPGGLVIPADGNEVAGRGPSQSMLWTPDGLDWARTMLDDGKIADVVTMAADKQGYVALGWARPLLHAFESAAWWSVDGRDWQRASLPEPVIDGLRSSMAAVPFAGGFVAISQADAPVPPDVLWSPDGQTWLALDRGPTAAISQPRPLVVGNRILVYAQPPDAADWVLWEATLDD